MDQAKRLKAIERENKRLKPLVAKQSLQEAIARIDPDSRVSQVFRYRQRAAPLGRATTLGLTPPAITPRAVAGIGVDRAQP